MMPNARNIPWDIVVDRLIDERTIDQKIYDALKQRIHMYGLTLEVRPPADELMHPRRHEREVRLYDPYASVGMYIDIEHFNNDLNGYMDYIAVRMVYLFARERFLIKRK